MSQQRCYEADTRGPNKDKNKLFQISPQEMGSAEDLMFYKAVVICLTALFEGLTVTGTPGLCGLSV